MDTILRAWIRLIRSHPFVWHVGASAILVALAHIILKVVFHQHVGLQQAVLSEVVIVLGATLVPLLVTVAALRRPLLSVLRLANFAPASATGVALDWIDAEVKELVRNVYELRTAGLRVTDDRVPNWVRYRCWETHAGRYLGIDGHVPSVYKRLYVDYLDSHERFIRRTGRKDSVRIIIADLDELKNDCDHDPNAREWFETWHRDNDVELRLMSPAEAARAARIHEVESADVAFWSPDTLIVWRQDDESGQTRMRLLFPGDPPFGQWKDYIDEVYNLSTEWPWITTPTRREEHARVAVSPMNEDAAPDNSSAQTPAGQSSRTC